MKICKASKVAPAYGEDKPEGQNLEYQFMSPKQESKSVLIEFI